MARGIDNFPTLSRTKSTPVPTARTTRVQDIRVLTSMPAGKMVPICAFPLLREDGMRRLNLRLNFEMMETAEILANAVNVNVKCYVVPNLAFDRFNGIDQLNRSYMKQPETDGGSVVAFFDTATAGADMSTDNPVLYYMGKHLKQGTLYNRAYNEAYNEIWNFRAKNRSPDITLRAIGDKTLAKAFWQHSQFNDVVPDFDQALIDGSVPLNVTQSMLPVKGVGVSTTIAVGGSGVANVRETKNGTGGATRNYPYGAALSTAGSNMFMEVSSSVAGAAPMIFAELAENGISVSLSNVELARKTQAFAVLRKQYGGIDDDYIIDLLMQGISIPEQAWRQPILLADRSTIFGMAKRYATDSTDLTASVVNGATFIDLVARCPVVPTGGVVMVVAEVTPEQLFERQADIYLHTTDQALLPDYLRDSLDPEKVEIVTNGTVDVKHATPTGTFGYAPLNHRWNKAVPAVGGKFYRPAVDDPFDEDRMRIWSVETANPTLSEDFYLCSNMHTKVFVVTNQDPFECVARGMASIEGNTVFGHMLIEASDDYATVMAEAPIDRIDKPASLEAGAAEEGEEQ